MFGYSATAFQSGLFSVSTTTVNLRKLYASLDGVYPLQENGSALLNSFLVWIYLYICGAVIES